MTKAEIRSVNMKIAAVERRIATLKAKLAAAAAAQKRRPKRKRRA